MTIESCCPIAHPQATRINSTVPGGYIENWSELHRVAGQVRPMVGVSEHAWTRAQERLGPQAATAAMALIFDKFSDGEVASPGGYLRGMVEKAGAGELHLERSFYGRLSGQAARMS